jgi:hypothetical protein
MEGTSTQPHKALAAYSRQSGGDNRLESIMQYLSLKADFWAYEKEIRLVNFDYFPRYRSEFF